MKPSITRACLSFVVFLSLTAGTAAAAGRIVSSNPGGIKDSRISPEQGQGPTVRPFKLKGGGAIDLATFTFEFGGTATHLGLYVATGQLDQQFQIQGTITGADGDIVNYTGAFQQGPLGEIEAILTITGGTGRFTNASGSATGPVALDPDFMFTINLAGTIAY
jgi:hypothetical protein